MIACRYKIRFNMYLETSVTVWPDILSGIPKNYNCLCNSPLLLRSIPSVLLSLLYTVTLLRISVPKCRWIDIVLQLIITVDNKNNDSYSLKHLMMEIFVVCSISVEKLILVITGRE